MVNSITDSPQQCAIIILFNCVGTIYAANMKPAPIKNKLLFFVLSASVFAVFAAAIIRLKI